MKTKIKIAAVFLILAMLCVSLCSCEVLKLVNIILPYFIPGDGSDTNINIDLSELFKCRNHVAVSYDSIDPTCNASGFVGGYYCQKCGIQISPQQEVPPQHKYDSEEDLNCSLCGFDRPIICDHVNTKILEETASTCIVQGHTAAEQCVDCEEILNGYEKKALIDHSFQNRDDDTCDVCGYVRKLDCWHTSTIQLKPIEATCQSSGLTSGWSCDGCGKIILAQTEIPAIAHKEGDWFVDKAPSETEKGKAHTECAVCYTVLSTKELDVILPESDENVSSGFVFELNEDENSYTLTDIGFCADTNIIIPGSYNGKPITKIDDAAFMNNYEITSVTIPEGVLTIGNGAFKDCDALTSVVIPSTVTRIGEYAFYNCALTYLTLPSGLKEIEAYSFYGTAFEKLEIPYKVTSIGEGAFAECIFVEQLVLSPNIKTIGKKAFYNLKNVESVVLPKTVKTIGENAFNIDGTCETERTIKIHNGVTKIGAYAFATNTIITYTGTSSDWNKILIDPRNYQYSVTTSNGSFVD